MVEEEHGPGCYDCGDLDGPFEWDHDKIPHAMDGVWTFGNVKKRCVPCHKAKTKRWDLYRINKLKSLEKRRKEKRTKTKHKTKWPSRKMASRPFPKKRTDK
jgi:hypothetical protein